MIYEIWGDLIMKTKIWCYRVKKLLFFETHHEKTSKTTQQPTKKNNRRDHDARHVAGTGNNNNLPVQRGVEEAGDLRVRRQRHQQRRHQMTMKTSKRPVTGRTRSFAGHRSGTGNN